MNKKIGELESVIESKLSEFISGHQVVKGELTIKTSLEYIVKAVECLATDVDFQFSTLIDITAIDYPERTERFLVVYHFLSMSQNQRIRVQLSAAEDDSIPSIVAIHPSANWFEREVFDMYGILFSNHPDLRRLLTDYGFSGYPLRKDFPTTGYVEVRYDEVNKKVVYEPTKLTQEFRQFDFLSPWEGAHFAKKETELDEDERS